MLSSAFATKAELYAAISRWMIYYNTRRRHSGNDQRSPINYENALDTAALAACQHHPALDRASGTNCPLSRGNLTGPGQLR